MRKLTRTAQRCITEISEFIGLDNQVKALEYVTAVETLFFGFPADLVTFKRASGSLPQSVREMPVKGFNGYTLRIMRHSDGITYLLSAHRPGASDRMKDQATGAGILEIRHAQRP